MWKLKNYVCPPVLPLKPDHGYKSRVIKDGYAAEQYIDWLEAGCSDAAVTTADATGYRIHLRFGPMVDYATIVYNLVVPIHSDTHGTVYIDDVIPKGLPAGAQKR